MGTPVDNAAEKEAKRSAIENDYSTGLANAEKQLIADKQALDETHRQFVRTSNQNRRDAFRAAGLNPDGSDPQGRPQG